MVRTAKQDLRELMGRDPTPKELEDFLRDLREDEPEVQGLPVFGNPLLGYELEQRAGLPNDPYTAQDAIKALKAEGFSHPTDE